MAVADDFPFLDDPRSVLGLASYRLTADEFRAGARADLAHLPWNRSWPAWLAFFGFWHALLAVSVWMVIADVRGAAGPFGFIDKIWILAAFLWAYFATIALWAGLYGIPSRVRRLYRKSPLAGAEVAFAFTADRWMFNAPLDEVSFGWEFIRDALEFEDGFGFRFKTAPGTVWVPDHALAAPFDHHAATTLFQSKVPKYRVVSYAAGRGAWAEERGAAAA